MKKIRLFLFGVVSLGLLSATTVNAQFKYGVKGGVSVNTVHFNKNRLDPNSMVGYQIGPMAEVMTPLFNLGFDIALLFSQNGLEYNSKRYTHNYLDIPLNIKWKVGIPVGKLFVAAGPYYAIRLGDENWSIPTASTSGNTTVTAVKKDAGINAGVGLEFLRYFQVGINYRHGIADGYEVSKSNTSYAQNRGWEMNVAVLF